MKKRFAAKRLATWLLLLAFIVPGVSCMTTYDVNGRPVQSVDPAVAVAGVAAAGLLGYAAANHHSHHSYYYGGGYYRGYRRCY